MRAGKKRELERQFRTEGASKGPAVKPKAPKKALPTPKGRALGRLGKVGAVLAVASAAKEAYSSRKAPPKPKKK